MSSAIDDISEILCSIDDKRKMLRLLRELFTPAEIRDVALRWRLMEMLNEGFSQRAIAERLGVSLCKITRGSRVLKSNGSVSKQYLEHPDGGRYASGAKTDFTSR